MWRQVRPFSLFRRRQRLVMTLLSNSSLPDDDAAADRQSIPAELLLLLEQLLQQQRPFHASTAKKLAAAAAAGNTNQSSLVTKCCRDTKRVSRRNKGESKEKEAYYCFVPAHHQPKPSQPEALNSCCPTCVKGKGGHSFCIHLCYFGQIQQRLSPRPIK